MSEFDGNFTETMQYWAPPSSPSPRTILAMLNQSDNDLNPITEMFPQTNFSKDHTEQRSGLYQRLAARIGFSLPTIETQNINSPFAAFFKNTTIPSPVLSISPRFSPSTMLLTPQIILSSSVTNNGPLKIVESSTDAKKKTSDNDLHHQPLHVDQSFQEESICNPSHESLVGPNDAHLVASFESKVVYGLNIISAEEESESKFEDENGGKDDTADEDEKDDEDNDIVAELDIKPPSPKRRRFQVLSNMIGATRTTKQQRVIIQMKCEEDNPNDGFRWRKYGQKVVKGNPNPRSYYKCNMYGCKVKKFVERGANNDEIIVITYDGIHEHAAPTSRRSRYGPQNRLGLSSLSQNDTTDTSQFGNMLPLSYSASLEEKNPFRLPNDMTKFYMTGLSKLPNLPVNQNSVSHAEMMNRRLT